MFDRILIESGKRKKQPERAVPALVSAGLHALFVGGIMLAFVTGAAPHAVTEPIRAFMVGGDPAPPPPPPPPPPGSAAGSSIPVTETAEPIPVDDAFVAPREVPREVPRADLPESAENAEGGTSAGVEGGVEGGVVGGVVGGVIGGVIGGTPGGTLGGTLGGTGTGTGPRRVGGNVKPPQVVYRVEPDYTEEARKSRLQGIVIIEAIIDINGNVTDARVLKGLAGGLDASALAAVRQWRFRPGTLDGDPVPVIFDLMVRFRLQ
ncbi:MAG TPA: energy transducer TonB [Thermoanaerobaculia bacterium]|nr:energy transducer TonB [Thermoanaerobaculia bacterium]